MKKPSQKEIEEFTKQTESIQAIIYERKGGMFIMPTPWGRACIMRENETFESMIKLLGTAAISVSKVTGKTRQQVLDAVLNRLYETEKNTQELVSV